MTTQEYLMFAGCFHHADTENYAIIKRSIDSHVTV